MDAPEAQQRWIHMGENPRHEAVPKRPALTSELTAVCASCDRTIMRTEVTMFTAHTAVQVQQRWRHVGPADHEARPGPSDGTGDRACVMCDERVIPAAQKDGQHVPGCIRPHDPVTSICYVDMGTYVNMDGEGRPEQPDVNEAAARAVASMGRNAEQAQQPRHDTAASMVVGAPRIGFCVPPHDGPCPDESARDPEQDQQPSWHEPDGSLVEPGLHTHYALWNHIRREWEELRENERVEIRVVTDEPEEDEPDPRMGAAVAALQDGIHRAHREKAQDRALRLLELDLGIDMIGQGFRDQLATKLAIELVKDIQS